jgi:putative membrane protein
VSWTEHQPPPEQPAPAEPAVPAVPAEPGEPGEPADPAGPAPTSASGARRLSPLTPAVRAPIVVLAVLGGSWQSFLNNGLGPASVAVLVLLAGGLVYGVASWLRTTYWIHDDELRIDTGVISRQSRRIRIDRLQGIDIVQPLVARIFGLAELRFDTASGSGREGALAFLPHSEAVALRAQLLRTRDANRGGAAGAPPGADEHRAPTAPPRVLATLDLQLLLFSTILSPVTVTFVVGGAAMLAGSVLTGAPLFAGGLLPVVIGTGIAVFRSFSAAYGFTVSDSEEGVAVRRGLTALTSQTVPLPRVQGVVVSEPVMWRPFGWARLEVSVAGGGDRLDDSTFSASTLLPVGPRDQVLWLARHVLGGEDPTTVPLVPAPRRARWVAPLSWWTLAFGHDDRYAVSRRGWWTRRFDVVPQAKVQSVRIRQGPWQSRLDLATLLVDSPVGKVAVEARHREPAEVRRLAEELVERGRRARRLAGTEPAPGASL